MATALAEYRNLEQLDAIVKEYNFDVIDANQGAFSKALALAKGIQELRKAFTPEVLKDFLSLQGSAIGFRTDRDDKKEGRYNVDEIRDCAIEALLRGAYPIGNEFNIISGRTYFTKEYFERRLREYPGFSDFVFIPDVPKMMNGGAVVHCRGTWKLNGVPMEAEEDIPIRVNDRMIIDAILGKAKRKFYARVLARISGSAHTVPDDDLLGAVDTVETEAKVVDSQTPPSSQSDKLKADLKKRQPATEKKESGRQTKRPDPPTPEQSPAPEPPPTPQEEPLPEPEPATEGAPIEEPAQPLSDEMRKRRDITMSFLSGQYDVNPDRVDRHLNHYNLPILPDIDKETEDLDLIYALYSIKNKIVSEMAK